MDRKDQPTAHFAFCQGSLDTHQRFELTPVFGSTTRKDTTVLDGTHTVFGQILLDDESTQECLPIVQDLPTYMGRNLEGLFRPAGILSVHSKDVGRSRLDKFLRGVEVTQVGLL